MPLSVSEILLGIWWLLGVGFLLANLRLLFHLLRSWKLRSSALLTWPCRKPPFYGLFLGLGVLFGCLVLFNVIWQRRSPTDVSVLGEALMFVYFAYALPLSFRIAHGFYDDGIWADRGFVPYAQIGGLTWREGRRDYAGADLPPAQSRPSSGGARGPLWRSSPPAAREDCRPRHPLHRQGLRPRRPRRAGRCLDTRTQGRTSALRLPSGSMGGPEPSDRSTSRVA